MYPSHILHNPILDHSNMETKDDSDKPPHPEYQYLQLVQQVISEGYKSDDRTGVGTYSLFGNQMRFDLTRGFPLLTTKKMYFKGILEELLWFISGSTDANELSKRGVKIWDGNGSREFLDKYGFKDRKEGDLGPVYGFQWRHWGAAYGTCDDDYTGKGIDQLMECIEMIKKTPNSRRIILNAWNVSDIPKMVLPPCHMMCQFVVNQDTKQLSCLMTQRSCDMGLGVPFNIASYALLTHIIAHVCDLEAHEFIYQLGHTHVYLNHVNALQEQLKRTPKAFPKLRINTKNKDINQFKSEDFELESYEHHDNIKMKMAL